MIVHIGYHKTGTTWLQESVFARHPNMAVPFSVAELNELIVRPNSFAFDPDKTRSQILSRTVESQRVPVLSYERLSGDPLSGGRDSKEMADRLYRLFPEAKIVIVLREQIEAIASIYKQYVLMGGCGTVSQFMSHPDEGLPEYAFFDVKYYCYDALVNYYLEKFGAPNVLVCYYEDLRRDWVGFLSNLLSAVGVDPSFIPNASERVHVSLSDTSIQLLAILNRFGRTYPHPAPFLEIDWIRRYGRSALYKTNNLWRCMSLGRSVKEQVRQQCPIERFRESNRQLSTLVSRDISELGYLC